jgi:chemotaxis family two-component system response regulator Rcp1
MRGTILIVEDNDGDLLLIRRSLEQHGVLHQLQIAKTGQTAIEYIARAGTEEGVPLPELMLLDLNLPKVDGADVLSHFRRHPKCKHLPVIVITSSGSPRDRDRISALGVSCYFRKPIEYSEYMQLGRIVTEVLSKSRSKPNL